MSLRDDIATMERHSDKGSLAEWFEGTAPLYDRYGVKVADPVFDINGKFTGHEWIPTGKERHD